MNHSKMTILFSSFALFVFLLHMIISFPAHSMGTRDSEDGDPEGNFLLLEKVINDASHDQFLSDQINKLSLKTILVHGKYQILYSENSLLTQNKNLNRLKIEVKKSIEQESFDLKMLLIGGKKQKELNHSWAAGIPKRFILLQVRLSLVEVLYGNSAAKKEKEKLKKENPQFKEFLEVQEQGQQQQSKTGKITIIGGTKKKSTESGSPSFNE